MRRKLGNYYEAKSAHDISHGKVVQEVWLDHSGTDTKILGGTTNNLASFQFFCGYCELSTNLLEDKGVQKTIDTIGNTIKLLK